MFKLINIQSLPPPPSSTSYQQQIFTYKNKKPIVYPELTYPYFLNVYAEIKWVVSSLNIAISLLRTYRNVHHKA